MFALNRLYNNNLGLGATGRILVCAPAQATTILCAASHHNSAPEMLVVNAANNSPSVRLAVAGKSGQGMEADAGNNEAFTMFAPIKGLGLAVVAKRDMSELYATIRVQFEVVLPILLFSVGLGMWLLSWQVAPLVRKIVVSEKKALSTNARLRESESRFRSAFEYSAVGMALVSLEGRWLRSNYSLGKILGYSEAEFLGMDYQRITNPDDIPKMKQKLADLVAGKSQGVSMTKRFITRNREMIWVMVNASLVYDMAHKPLYYIFQIQDIDQQKHAEERLTLMAYHDALTGLDNRAAIERDVEAALLTAGSKQQNFALLFLDLDHFKEVNDLYGHDVGDALLKEVAQRLQRSVRRTDKVGRLGGDEFVILLENIADEEVVVEIAKKILRTIAVPMVINDVTLSVTSSVGISRYPNNGVTMEALMKRADIALYCAKECGKDNFQFFESASINP
jgi:diguanylate cyclase (GGDEF)-like protein/PAS domain S-box-containing protein